MNKITLTTTIKTIGVAAFIVISGASAVFAADNNNAGQALEIAPPVVNLSASPGETVKAQISLRDIASTSLIVRGQVNDFVASGEDGIPKILLEDSEEKSPYSMKSWFAPLDELTLKSKQIENLTVTINVPADAAPGGYYSVIRFTATPPELEGTGVSLSASLGALVLMQVKGEAKEQVSIEQFFSSSDGNKVNSLFESAPVTFVARLKNSGNLHEQPVGQAVVTDMFGKKVATVNINLARRNVLPGSTRKFDGALDKAVIGNKMLFGRYTAELKIAYGSGTAQKDLVSTITFWVIPYKLITGIIIALIGGFFGLRYLLKRYNQYIIDQARKSRKTRR